MPWENIGDCGFGQMPQDREWIVFQLEMGIHHLRFICGAPPPGCKLDIMWHEHDLGDYASIGLWCRDMDASASHYIQDCEIVLAAFDDAIPWSALSPERLVSEIIGPEVVKGLTRWGNTAAKHWRQKRPGMYFRLMETGALWHALYAAQELTSSLFADLIEGGVPYEEAIDIAERKYILLPSEQDMPILESDPAEWEPPPAEEEV